MAGEMTCREAQRLGVDRIRELYGEEHWQRMGEAGGKALVEKYGQKHMRKIGRRGGRVTKGER